MSDTASSGKMPRKLDLTPEETKIIIDYIQSNPADLLQIPTLRAKLAESRFKRLDPAALEIWGESSDAIRAHAIEHNLDNLRQMQALERPSLLIYALRSIEYIVRNVADLTVLTIGPRTESELFSLIAAGFAPDRITGLDLISYSNFVQVGDVHAMPFGDNSFDVVIMGWVLPYSADNQTAANELLRVAKPGAHIAVGCPTRPLSIPESAEAENAVGGIPVKSDDGAKTVSSFFNSGQILRLFEDRIDTVIQRQDPHPTMALERSNVTVVLRLASE